MPAQTLANRTFRFLGIKRTDASGGDVVIRFPNHLPKLFQTALTPFKRVKRFAQDVLLAFELPGLHLRSYALFEIRRKLL